MIKHVLNLIEEKILEMRAIAKIDAYFFGSALVQKALWSDIDILLLCDNEIAAAAARKSISPLLDEFPIDLIIMTLDEEAELDFVRKERCICFASTNPKHRAIMTKQQPLAAEI
ncbi:MAG: hypothetical protein DHS20C06_17780 [Hyphobacterium sp.]|nr:MAG: hypothetical protein DHS20C06_17780 [Hyphobacterium sp.]